MHPPIVGVTAELLHIMSKLPNNIVFCLTEAPLYQPHLRRFFLINLGDVFSYQSLRLDGHCTLLMGRIPDFSFLHRVFLHLTSPFRGWQLHQLLVKLPVLLCISICFDPFHRKKCVLKFYHQFHLRLNEGYKWFRRGGHTQTQLYLKTQARLASLLAHLVS